MMRVAGFVGLLIALVGCESRFLPPAPAAFSSARLGGIVRDAAARYAVSPGLVRAVVMAESSGNAGAVSSAGARGLMQLMPATAAECGVVNIFDPVENVDCGTRYLQRQVKHFHGNVTLAVAAYNAGPNAVDRYGAVPPYPETRTYVARVLSMYR